MDSPNNRPEEPQTPAPEPEPIPFDDDTEPVINLDKQREDKSQTPPDTSRKDQAESMIRATSSADKTQGGKVSSSGEQVNGVKIFFAKLHAGSIEFLEGQIKDWLKANPGVSIKRTNTVVGEIQAKKTEPNIIVSVWY